MAANLNFFHVANDLSEIRPLTRISGIFAALISDSSDGHNSDSNHNTASGRKCFNSRFAYAGTSNGINWWNARGGRRLAIISADVSVPVVTIIESSGSSFSSLSISGSIDTASPTDAPCIQ